MRIYIEPPSGRMTQPEEIRRYLAKIVDNLNYALNVLDDANISAISTDKVRGFAQGAEKIFRAQIGQAQIGAAQIQHLEAQVAKITTAVIETGKIDWAQIKELQASIAKIAQAQIGEAEIDWAKIKGLVAGTALLEKTEAGKLHAADLAVTDANIVNLNADKISAGTLSVERLVIVGTDKSIVYEVNRQNGTEQLSQTTIDGGAITQKTITAEQIIAQGITADCLNVDEIFSNEALIGKVTSRNIDVGELFASSATAGVIHTSNIAADVGKNLDITANGAITLMAGAIDGLEEGQAALSVYIRVEADGLHIGKQGEAIELQLGNDRISFFDQYRNEVAYISSSRMFITEAEITQRLTIGGYGFQRMEDRSLGLLVE